jgi:hypothetical protein
MSSLDEGLGRNVSKARLKLVGWEFTYYKKFGLSVAALNPVAYATGRWGIGGLGLCNRWRSG